jgi:drug/metabolite transporter (DMT)-like permease
MTHYDVKIFLKERLSKLRTAGLAAIVVGAVTLIVAG